MERSKSRRGKACLTGIFLVILMCYTVACVPQSRKPAVSLPRANPGYVQWLERQSMLAASPQYTRLVSGTELLWRAPTADKPAVRVDTLLEAADTWLFVQPQLLLTENQRPVLAELSAPTNLRLLQTLGIGGLYLQPTAESAALWGGQKTPGSGEDISSLSFAPHVGTEKHYTDMARLAEQQQLQLGSGLVPAAVGIGPDFFLAARHVREYPGTMMMVEIPKEFWGLLPPAANVALPAQPPAGAASAQGATGGSSITASASAQAAADATNAHATLSDSSTPSAASAAVPTVSSATGPWAATPLQGAHNASLTALAEKNILPPALLRDSLTWATPGGWAATPIIEGIDGVERRFVYRYHGTVLQPLLQWDDPSRNAQRILSASIIRTIGSQQQTLGGLYPEAWAGLDAIAHDLVDAPTTDAAAATRLPEPAASALRSLSREISRYGGWSMQGDVFPPSLTAAILRTGVDFTTDSITSPLAEYALLTGDALPLKQALKDSLSAGIDQRRLVRSLPHYRGLNLRPLHESPQGRNVLKKWKEYLQNLPTHEGKSNWTQQAPLQDSVWYVTGASLAAMAAGFSPEAATRPESRAAIRARHLLLTGFRAGLPGLLLLSGQDLSGSLNLPSSGSAEAPDSATAPAGRTLGAWAFSAPAAVALSTRTGHSRAHSLYGPLSAQTAEPDSYVQQIAALTALRKQWGLARATLLAVPETKHAATVAVLLQLPNGKYVLNIANFSDKSRSEHIALPMIKAAKRASNPLLAQQSVSFDGQLLRLELDPWQCSLIYVD